jgi:4-amino-4-deoxy-L-arabinose transferase-like glycosyltransferase
LHASFGLFLKIFGNTVFNAHLLALIVSFLTLFALFNFCEKYFGKWAGVFAVAALLPQPLFLAQSNLVLPEMALSLFIILSLHFFLDHKMVGYFLSASAAILIKESAIVMFATLNL